jgi:hypothetical protein
MKQARKKKIKDNQENCKQFEVTREANAIE